VNEDSRDFTLRVITAVAFNNIDATDEINKSFNEVSEAIVNKFVINALPLGKYLPAWITGDKIFTRYKETFKKWTSAVIEATSNTQNAIPSLINLLVHSKDEETNTSLTYQQIIDNIKIFYLAGHETTSSLLTVTFYQLLRHPEIIKKIQNEIDSVLGNSKEITIDHIEKLTYLQCVVKESLRIRTPAGAVTRETNEDVYLGKYFVPKGTRVVVCIHAMHHDPNYWNKPEEYIPERFMTVSDSTLRAEGYYLPFSAGPRICIGQRLAREEAIVFLALILKNFDVTPPINFDKNKPMERSGLTSIKDVNILLSKRK